MSSGKAVLVVDMLKDFIEEGAVLEVPKGREIAPNIKRLIDNARNKGILVVYVCDSHTSDDPEFAVWPPHAVEGTEGAEVIDPLKPQKNDVIVKKLKYDGFLGTMLDLVLRSRGINTLIITGVLTNICVLYTAATAAMLGYKVVIPKDCVASISDEDHEWALRQMENVLKLEVLPLDSVLATL
ncbi:MAG: cysteine hydrolase family protein [Candidatus Freyarchaeota archaeon]|nr:isochorismatase family cysteine hydrolase [Candidatus Freyrarchaeum guaymaensis]HDO81025.1 cysteine hydrolase [Candidatus Bathyarchaeota archaeon]